MEPRKNLARFIERAQRPDHHSEEERARIDAHRIERYTGSAHRKDRAHLTPEQLEARDAARLKALERRRGRG
jgi:hypothetical protein